MPSSRRPGSSPTSRSAPALVAAAHEGIRTAITPPRGTSPRRAVHLRRVPPARPPRRPRLPRRLLLPEQRRRGGADAARRRPRRRSGSSTSTSTTRTGRRRCVERHAGDATLHSLHAAPVTNVADRHRCCRGSPANGRSRSAARPTPTPTSTRSTSRSRRSASAARAGRLARLRHGRRRPARQLGLRAAGSSRRSASLLAASGLPVCVVQEGGYALERLAECSSAFSAGLLGAEVGDERAERAWRRSAPGWTRSTTRSPACSASASTSAARSPSTRARTTSR